MHPVLVVYLDERNKKVVGARRHFVVDAQIEDSGLFVGQCHRQPAYIAGGNGVVRIFCHGDFFTKEVLQAHGSFVDAQIAHRRFHSLPDARLNIFDVYLFFCKNREIMDYKAFILVNLYLKGKGLGGFTLVEHNRHGRIIIERQRVQTFLYGDLQVKAEALRGLLHQHGRTDSEDFVVDVSV